MLVYYHHLQQFTDGWQEATSPEVSPFLANLSECACNWPEYHESNLCHLLYSFE